MKPASVAEPEKPVLRMQGLTKRYGDVRAVTDLDLDVRRGEIYGFLGRNGAGKTTTIRMILGLIRPTRGTVSVFGRRIEPGETGVFRRVGYLVETPSAYPNLTVRENLEIQRRLTGANRAAVDQAIDRLRLREYAERRAGRLSLGNKQRLSLARALLHAPDLLILDEPANGLDPAGIVEIRLLLRELADRRGATIFISSHILAEIAHLADRIGIIHEGRLLEELDRSELASRGRTYIEVGVSEPQRAVELLRKAGFPDPEPDGTGLLRFYGAREGAEEIAAVLVGAGLRLFRLAEVGEDLESLFLRLTGGIE